MAYSGVYRFVLGFRVFRLRRGLSGLLALPSFDSVQIYLVGLRAVYIGLY